MRTRRSTRSAKPISDATTIDLATQRTEPSLDTPDLETAIASLINVGHREPLEIVEHLENSYGDQWLREQAAYYAADLAAQIAQRLLGQRRRNIEHRIRPDSPNVAARIHEATVWIPNPDGYVEYKPASKCTPQDLRLKADYYEKLASGSLIRAIWYRENATLIETEGVQTWGEVPPEKIPALPTESPLLALTA